MVLLVDDQPDVLEALRQLLKGAGYQSESALSPEQALQAAGSRDHELVLIDMNYARDTTSGAEGLALLDALHARRPEVPVIVMTAWSTIDLAVEAMRRGASDFITKPWENRRVLDVISQQRGRDHESSVARRVQRRLLPRPHFSAPGMECECVFHPAGDLSGDLCDVFPTGPASSAFLLGDVSGKGTGAALLMAGLQATIRSHRDLAGEPALLVSRANRLFFESTTPEHFATLFFGSFDAAARTLRYVNCGHPAGVLLRRNGDVERLDSTALILGAFENTAFADRTLVVGHGDRLVLFSDGVAEARPDEDDRWAVECIRMLGRAGSKVLAESLAMAAVSSDDVTVLDLQFV